MQLVAGRITRPHGVRGEVAVHIRTDEPDRRFVVGAVLATDPPESGPLRIESVRDRTRAGSWSASPATRTGPARSRSSASGCWSTRRRSSDPDAFYDHELVGLVAVDDVGSTIGKVADVLHQPGHDLLVVEREDGPAALVPFVAAIVPQVDVAAGRLVVHAPPGLLDDAGADDDADPDQRGPDVRVDVITIFPDYLTPLGLSLVGKARENGVLDLRVHDLRDWTTDRHRSVDDTPYGGGPGMVMRPEPWTQALETVSGGRDGAARPRLVIPTPTGRPFTHAVAAELAARAVADDRVRTLRGHRPPRGRGGGHLARGRRDLPG